MVQPLCFDFPVRPLAAGSHPARVFCNADRRRCGWKRPAAARPCYAQTHGGDADDGRAIPRLQAVVRMFPRCGLGARPQNSSYGRPGRQVAQLWRHPAYEPGSLAAVTASDRRPRKRRSTFAERGQFRCRADGAVGKPACARHLQLFGGAVGGGKCMRRGGRAYCNYVA